MQVLMQKNNLRLVKEGDKYDLYCKGGDPSTQETAQFIGENFVPISENSEFVGDPNDSDEPHLPRGMLEALAIIDEEGCRRDDLTEFALSLIGEDATEEQKQVIRDTAETVKQQIAEEDAIDALSSGGGVTLDQAEMN